MRRTGWLLVVTLMLTGCSTQAEAPKEGVDVGDLAPDISLRTLDADTFKLHQHKGEIVLLHWYATWCQPCLKEWPHMREMTERYKNNKNVRIVGLDVGEPMGKAKAYANQHNLSFTVAVDLEENAFFDYEVPGMPYTVLIDQQGLVALRSKVTDVRVDKKIDQLLKKDEKKEK